ncbi:hypothetical protein BDN71DRAFT_1459320 [Pleurotus eryngii]|uniref:KA1 domain-containing protein n=1 Tax=Pleurotus eryngii TaxID=5323 RepID=A0A9P6AA33_PLEER|nr:hypothetical protein BDN71DRAFT_1459320 [Pleurotus eryngii]
MVPTPHYILRGDSGVVSVWEGADRITKVQSGAAEACQNPSSTPLMSSIRTQIRPSFSGSSNAWVPPSRSGLQTKSLNDAIRIHDGPVTSATTTNIDPREVMKRVKQVLEVNMRLQIYPEGEFKYRCVRVKRDGEGVSETTTTSTAGKEADSQLPGGNGSMGSSQVDHRRGLRHAASSGMLLNGASGLRGSLKIPRNVKRVASFDDDPVSPSSPISESPGLPPIYGDPLQDPGDEVRFFVELTRLDGLDDTYSLDIRRLRGNLRSYKFLHDVMRDCTNLQ